MYNQITSNKRKTWFLIVIVSAILIALFWLLGYLYDIDAGIAVIAGTLFSTVFSLVSYYISDKVALSTSGAKEITKDQAPDLWNLVENLCIADGIPMPRVHIIDDPALNAFATGRDPEHASIAFTTGLLSSLNRRELEGVAAHELSHVKNYDIRVMTVVVILIGAISIAANILLHGGHLGGKQRDNGNATAILAIIGLVLAILSPLVAELIKLAISRRREYLADASGALLTRYPEGLASALEKISQQSKVAHASQATAHLFIANPFGSARSTLSNLFSTHPPVANRIAKLREMGH